MSIPKQDTFLQSLAVPGPHLAGNRENPFGPAVESIQNRFFEERAIMKRIAFFIYGTLGRSNEKRLRNEFTK